MQKKKIKIILILRRKVFSYSFITVFLEVPKKPFQIYNQTTCFFYFFQKKDQKKKSSLSLKNLFTNS